jgi:predicted nucleic acid-binding protein
MVCLSRCVLRSNREYGHGVLLGADTMKSIPVVGELEFGAEKSAHSARHRARLADLARSLPLVGIDADTARQYARIRASLERQGTLIGANDLWIAAQALAIDGHGQPARIPAGARPVPRQLDRGMTCALFWRYSASGIQS